MVNKALVVIDYTHDFVHDEGKLTCGKPGQKIAGRISRLISQFIKDPQAYVVIASDVHDAEDPYHPETELFPPHNLRGDKGRRLYGEVGRTVQSLQEGMSVDQEKRLHFIDKTRYSAFAGTDLELRLRERGIGQVHLVGVCTDICVLHTAVDAYNKMFDIVVYADAVQSFDQQGHEWALGHFENTLGATIVRED